MTINSDSEIRNGYIWTQQMCPICEIAPTKFIGKRGGPSHREGLGVECEIWRCASCKLVFPNPMPFPEKGLGQHYGVDADDYFSSHDKGEKFQSAAGLVADAEAILGRRGKLLDIGVGRGETLMAAKDIGWDAEGIEPSETFANYVEKRTGLRIWRQPIEEAELPDGDFDVVILAAVLEHLYDPDTVIRKIATVLKKGGLLYLDVPNERGLYFRMGNLYQRLRGRDWCVNLAPTFSPYHVFGFNPYALRKLLRKHGLEPKTWNVYGGNSLVPSHGGLAGMIESVAAKAVTSISELGEMGTYIETWAVKK